jgi:hypothetical protein
MAKAKKKAAPKYTCNRVKPISAALRYGVLRQQGITFDGVTLQGKALDDYIDEKVWRANHPGEEPIVRF